MLHWLASRYCMGAGVIVDGGCFVGGSTLPLAEGLRARRGDAAERIHVYDRFEVEPYMSDMYFEDEGLRGGDSFRPVFDANTVQVADLLRVHEGDLLANGWSGDPIELLFVDFSKTWDLNDFIVKEFFPSLIAGRSVVVQQDFVFSACPWVPVTMEYLSEYFEPVAFTEYCSVVYFCHRQPPRDIAPVSSLDHERQLALMDSAIARFLGYPRGVLQCAKAALLINHGDYQQAHELLGTVREQVPHHDAVRAALALVSSFA
jgi:hypothetical protein